VTEITSTVQIFFDLISVVRNESFYKKRVSQNHAFNKLFDDLDTAVQEIGTIHRDRELSTALGLGELLFGPSRVACLLMLRHK
jgi:hypothetical protein